MSGAPVSHGRGGAANIRPDDTPYADGEIVREGPVGDQGDGRYSSGRGGVANIGGDPAQRDHRPGDEEVVPETAVRLDKEQSHHFGRGGAGNEAHVHEHKEHGLVDKAKNLIKGDKK